MVSLVAAVIFIGALSPTTTLAQDGEIAPLLGPSRLDVHVSLWPFIALVEMIIWTQGRRKQN